MATSSERKLPIGLLPPPSAGEDLSQDAVTAILSFIIFYRFNGSLEHWTVRQELPSDLAMELVRAGIVDFSSPGFYKITPKGVAMARMLSLS